MGKSVRLGPTVEEKKKELLQYRIFENDSEGDVMEGLGNTTLNIPAVDSSSEGSKGKDNIQRESENVSKERKAG